MKNQPQKKFKLISNVSEFGLLQPLAKTRLRLVISVLSSYAAMVGITLFVADYINQESASIGLNMILITVTMLALLVASYIAAMLIGDLFFPGRWRERVLLNQKIASPQEDLDIAQHQNFNLHFLVVLAFVIVGNYYGTQSLTGDYMDEYHEVGFNLTRLRADDVQEKREALKDLSKAIYKKRWHETKISSAILHELKSSDEETRRWAIFTSGKAAYTKAYPALVEELSSGSPETRAETAEALGMMQDRRATPHLIKTLQESQENERITVGVLRGLGMLRDLDAGSEILNVFQNTQNDQIRAHAAWALGQIKYKDAHDPLFKAFKEAKTTPQACASLEGLKYLAQESDVRTIKEEFLLLDEDPVCPYIIWEDRHEEKVYVMYKESYRGKFLKIVANAAGGKEHDWFFLVASDKDKPYEVRSLATEILRQIKAAKATRSGR